MSLEVDGRPGGVPIIHQREGEGFKYINGHYESPSNTPNPYAAGINESSLQLQQLSKPKDVRQGGKVRPRPRFIFCRGLSFAFVSVLAVVAAGVAGRIALRRGQYVNACMTTLQHLNATLNAANSSLSNSTTTDNPTSNANTPCQTSNTQNSNSASFIPTSDYSSLASPYTPPPSILDASTSKNSFNIHCDTDYIHASADFMSFLAFTFEDCIARLRKLQSASPKPTSEFDVLRREL